MPTPQINCPSQLRLTLIGGTSVAAGAAWIAAVAFAPAVAAKDVPREIFTLLIAAAIALTAAAVMQGLTYSAQKQCAENQEVIAVAIAQLAAEQEQLGARFVELYWTTFAEGAVAGAEGNVVPFPRMNGNGAN